MPKCSVIYQTDRDMSIKKIAINLRINWLDAISISRFTIFRLSIYFCLVIDAIKRLERRIREVATTNSKIEDIKQQKNTRYEKSKKNISFMMMKQKALVIDQICNW